MRRAAISALRPGSGSEAARMAAIGPVSAIPLYALANAARKRSESRSAAGNTASKSRNASGSDRAAAAWRRAVAALESNAMSASSTVPR